MGFTLIELMIVVAIVAILMAVAVPGYSDYQRRGQAQEAPVNLAAFRAAMEQYYQDNRRYGTGTGTTCGVTPPAAPTAKNFDYDCTSPTGGQSYTATATGKSGGLVSGLAYTVDQLNNQGTTCTSCAWNFSSAQTTWVTRKP